MDYVLIIIAAFLVGFGRSAQRWRRTAALVSGACLPWGGRCSTPISDHRFRPGWGDRVIRPQPPPRSRRPCWLEWGALLAGVMAALLGRRQPVRLGLPMLPIHRRQHMNPARANHLSAALGLVPLALLLAAL